MRSTPLVSLAILLAPAAAHAHFILRAPASWQTQDALRSSRPAATRPEAPPRAR